MTNAEALVIFQSLKNDLKMLMCLFDEPSQKDSLLKVSHPETYDHQQEGEYVGR